MILENKKRFTPSPIAGSPINYKKCKEPGLFVKKQTAHNKFKNELKEKKDEPSSLHCIGFAHSTRRAL